MSYLHSIGYIHCDLALSNVLVNNFLFPKLCDFGLSRLISENNEVKKCDIVGSKGFIAPEIIRNQTYVTAGDVYSFAIFVYELLTETDPYSKSNIFYTFKCVVGKERPKYNEKINESLWKLINNCWSDEPKNRPSFEQIVNDLGTNPEYITNDVDKSVFECYINFIQKHKPIPSKILKQYIKKH